MRRLAFAAYRASQPDRFVNDFRFSQPDSMKEFRGCYFRCNRRFFPALKAAATKFARASTEDEAARGKRAASPFASRNRSAQGLRVWRGAFSGRDSTSPAQSDRVYRGAPPCVLYTIAVAEDFSLFYWPKVLWEPCTGAKTDRKRLGKRESFFLEKTFPESGRIRIPAKNPSPIRRP